MRVKVRMRVNEVVRVSEGGEGGRASRAVTKGYKDCQTKAEQLKHDFIIITNFVALFIEKKTV